MEVFRLTRCAYSTELTGRYTAKFNHRWNSKGSELIYTAQSRALALAELAVHLPRTLIPFDYCMMCIWLPDELYPTVEVSSLPKGWQGFPYLKFTQQVGDSFVNAKRDLALRIPSAVVPGDYNYLLNPNHPAFGQVKCLTSEPFPFDARLFK